MNRSPLLQDKKSAWKKHFLAPSEELKMLCVVFLGSGCEPTETETGLSSVNILHLELYMSFSNDIENIPLNDQLFHCFCCDFGF